MDNAIILGTSDPVGFVVYAAVFLGLAMFIMFFVMSIQEKSTEGAIGTGLLSLVFIFFIVVLVNLSCTSRMFNLYFPDGIEETINDNNSKGYITSVSVEPAIVDGEKKNIPIYTIRLPKGYFDTTKTKDGSTDIVINTK